MNPSFVALLSVLGCVEISESASSAFTGGRFGWVRVLSDYGVHRARGSGFSRPLGECRAAVVGPYGKWVFTLEEMAKLFLNTPSGPV